MNNNLKLEYIKGDVIIFKKKHVILIIFVLFLGLVVAGCVSAADRHTKVVNSTSKTDNSKVQLAKTTVPFIENKGQYTLEVKYYANTF